MATEGRGYEDDERETRVVARAGRRGAPHEGPPGPMYGGYGPWGYGGRFGGRPQYPIETKPFFLTSEFFGVVLVVVAMAIGAAVNEDFDSRLFWTLTTVLVGLYVLSRGIAKSGTKSRAHDPREELQLFQREGRGE